MGEAVFFSPRERIVRWFGYSAELHLKADWEFAGITPLTAALALIM